MNSPVADKICTGEFFYVTGNFVEFSDKVKSPVSYTHLTLPTT